MNGFTDDAFLGGKVRVLQPVHGFRAGTDSVLLAAALDSGATGRALEVGCGSGGALFPAAYRLPGMSFTGLEVSQSALQLAERGRDLNQMEHRVDLIHGDAGAMPPDWQNRFDLVFSNPPFFEAGTAPEPGEGKQQAYIESIDLKAWLHAMLFALRPKGQFVLIHRAADLARILAVLERQVGEIAVLPIRSYPGADAKRVIVKARKGLRSGPMRLLAGIDLYTQKGGEPTSLAVSITRDGAGLDWGRC